MRLYPHTVQELQSALASVKTCEAYIQAALGTTGKPGSGPEYPPEGLQLLPNGETYDVCPGTNYATWIPLNGCWTPEIREAFHHVLLMSHDGFRHAIRKPEPVKLSDQERIIGWRGPTGFRLQTFQHRGVTCAVCLKEIKAGERLARWRFRFPENQDLDHVCGKPGNEENHHHAHVECLYKTRTLGHWCGLSYQEATVPEWLREKRKKFDKQH